MVSMARVMILAATLTGAMGCQPAPPPAASSKIRLLTPVNSKERFSACAADWGPSGKGFADCWAGTKYTRAEFCSNAGSALGDGSLSDFQKAAIYEKMSNYGCMR